MCECDQAKSGKVLDSYHCRHDNASEVCSGQGEYAGSVFVVRAAKIPTTLTMGSSVNARISAVVSTEDSNVENT